MKPDASGFRSFDPVRGSRMLVGMARHATAEAARRSGSIDANTFVLGHGEPPQGTAHAPVGARRFAFLPIPSIESRGKGKSRVVGSVRRLLVTCFAEGCEREIAWVRRALSGVDLVDTEHDATPALLSLAPPGDGVLKDYLATSATWTTTTPVVLPGFDDGKDGKTEMLLRKAIVQAGFSEALAACAELEWRGVGFLPGLDPASRYHAPPHLRNYPKRHVRLTWRDASGKPLDLPGPICLGGGRYVGLGLFAAAGD